MEWIGTDAGRLVIVRQGPNGDSLLLDDPGRLRFRQPVPRQRAAELSLREIREVEPGELDAWCGWYAGPGRRLLLTQVPERSLGEPMVLIGDGAAVLRAYPVGPGRFVRADGLAVSLVTAESGGPALRLGEDAGATALLPRDERLVERPVEFGVGQDAFSATLITPAGPGPHPAAVVVHGAAGGQRDFCRLLVEPALDAGVAVLLYDKRGHGRSTGSPEVTIFDQAQVAAAGLDRLADEPDIDTGRLGLIGFSNGMWAVPMVAASRSHVAFVAGIGSPGVSMAESEVHRRSKVLREAGMKATTVDAVAEAWRYIFAVLAAGGADTALTTRLSAALDRLRAADDLARYEVPDYAREDPRLSAVPPLGPVHELVAALSGQPDPELDHDPAGDYARMRCPLFLQWGADDTSVPVELSVARISAAVPEPSTAALRVYPDVEHMLNATVTDVAGISAEQAMYGFHRFRWPPRVREDLRDWLAATIGRRSK